MSCAVGGSLRRSGGGMAAEKEEASTLTASFGQDEIGCIRDDAKNHVTGVEVNDGIGWQGNLEGECRLCLWVWWAWLDSWKFRLEPGG